VALLAPLDDARALAQLDQLVEVLFQLVRLEIAERHEHQCQQAAQCHQG
jgi:hypothetical protein